MRTGKFGRPYVLFFPPQVGDEAWAVVRALRDGLQPGVGRIPPPHLRARAPVEQHDVGREVVVAADQRGTDSVGVDGHVERLELPDPLRGEAAGGNDLDVVEAGPVERSRTFSTSRGLTPVGVKPPISSHSEQSTSCSDVSSRTPHSFGPNADATSSAVCTESLTKSTSTVTFISRVVTVGEQLCGAHRVPAVGGDQAVRDGADPAAAPPRRLRVRGDADRARDVGAQPSPVCTSQWSWRAGK